MATMIKTPNETVAKMANDAKVVASEVAEKSQESVAQYIGNAEKAMIAFMDVQAAFYKASDAVMRQAYANYTSNVAAVFEGTKALNNASDLNAFYAQSMENLSKIAETTTEQYKGMSKLLSAVSKDATKASQAAYAKSMA